MIVSKRCPLAPTALLLLALVAIPARPGYSQGPPGVLSVKVVNAKSAVQHFLVASLADGDLSAFSNTVSVPAGKRLVIEHVSALARLQESQSPAEVGFSTTVDGTFAAHHLLLVKQSTGGSTAHTFVTNHAVQIYADPGTTIRLSVLRNTGTGSGAVFATLSGYLVDFP